MSDLPDFSYIPPLADLKYRSFKSGSRFLRIYDHVKPWDPSLGANRYEPTDYNSVLVRDLPAVRGRFSAAAKRRGARFDPYSYLYLGEERVDERTAVLECIDLLSLRHGRTKSSRIVDLDLVKDLSIAYIQLSRPITLLDLSTQPFVDKYRADLRVLQGTNYRSTRQWARYFRLIAPHIDGLFYTPLRYGSPEDGGNIVLFAEFGKNGDAVDPRSVIRPLASDWWYYRMIALSDVTDLFPGWTIA